MVGEFPELQGIMGATTRATTACATAVADAIEDHYKPRFAGDALPRGDVGLVVALADKLETLAGLFGIGQLPTGDKDPFALRRHALGVIRMLVERDLPLSLPQPGGHSLRRLPGRPRPGAGRGAALHLRPPGGLPARAGLQRAGGRRRGRAAARALGRDSRKRLAAVRAFAGLPEAAALAAANKRVGNILKKSDEAAGHAARRRAAASSRPNRRWPPPCAAVNAGGRRGVRARRLRRLAAGAGGAEGPGRCLLRRRDGQCRRPGAARQPPGAAGGCTRR
jgi:glycyl-tRNA synthetase beta chain